MLSNLVITTNSMGLWKYVRFNRKIIISVNIYCSKANIWSRNSVVKFVRYNREFIITVIVIIEFDRMLMGQMH